MATITVHRENGEDPWLVQRLAVASAAAAGGLLAMQTRVNGELPSRPDDGLIAASLACTSGLLLVALGMLSRTAVRGPRCAASGR